MKTTDRLLQRFSDVADVMRAAPASRSAPYIIGAVLGAILGPLLAIFASVTTGLVVLGSLGALSAALWATSWACKGVSRRYGG